MRTPRPRRRPARRATLRAGPWRPPPPPTKRTQFDPTAGAPGRKSRGLRSLLGLAIFQQLADQLNEAGNDTKDEERRHEEARAECPIEEVPDGVADSHG